MSSAISTLHAFTLASFFVSDAVLFIVVSVLFLTVNVFHYCRIFRVLLPLPIIQLDHYLTAVFTELVKSVLYSHCVVKKQRDMISIDKLTPLLSSLIYDPLVEFVTNEAVHVQPMFDMMNLREDLVRGIDSYGEFRTFIAIRITFEP